MSKRAFSPALLGLLLLSVIACFGSGGEKAQDQSGTAAAAASATITTSPTQIATAGELFLQLVEPVELEVFTNLGSLTVAGRTRVDAIVTINDTMVEPNINGEFSLDMALEEGPNIIEVVASVASGEQMDLVLVAIYVP